MGKSVVGRFTVALRSTRVYVSDQQISGRLLRIYKDLEFLIISRDIDASGDEKLPVQGNEAYSFVNTLITHESWTS